MCDEKMKDEARKRAPWREQDRLESIREGKKSSECIGCWYGYDTHPNICQRRCEREWNTAADICESSSWSTSLFPGSARGEHHWEKKANGTKVRVPRGVVAAASNNLAFRSSGTAAQILFCRCIITGEGPICLGPQDQRSGISPKKVVSAWLAKLDGTKYAD